MVGCAGIVEVQIGSAVSLHSCIFTRGILLSISCTGPASKADLDSIACNAAISACEKSVEWRLDFFFLPDRVRA